VCCRENGANQKLSFFARHPPLEERIRQHHCSGSLKSCAIKANASVSKKTLSVSVLRIMKLFLWPPITRHAMTRINGSVHFKLHAMAALSLGKTPSLDTPWKGSGVGPGDGTDVLMAVLRICGARSGILARALFYKPAGRGFDSRWCHWKFSVTQSCRSHFVSGVDSSSNRNEYQAYFLGVKAAGA
jgi:hypothetical protein